MATGPAFASYVPDPSGRPAGSAVDWQVPPTGPSAPPGVNDLVQVAPAEDSVLGLRADGSVLTWGGPFAFSTPTPEVRDAVAVAAGPGTATVLRRTGAVVSWGFGAPDTTVLGMDNRAVAASYGLVVALKDDGSVAATGADAAGQAEPPVLQDVVAIAAGGFRGVSSFPCGFALALTADGEVTRWGGRALVSGCGGRFDRWTPEPRRQRLVGIAAGSDYALGIRPNGTVVAWGGNPDSPVLQVPAGLRDVVALAAGPGRAVALRSDGSVTSWGSDFYAPPPAGLRASAVAASSDHQLAIVTDAALGSPVLQTRVDANPAGRAEAFRFVATRTGSVARLHAYVDDTSTADQIHFGVYTDAGGHPGVLLGENSVGAPLRGAWSDFNLKRYLDSSVDLVAGRTYWIALLAPKGRGTLAFRDHQESGGMASEVSRLQNLTELPAVWKTGQTFTSGPVSAFVR